ncbi:uncharacterized protein LOC129231358 [Uloborus diversus]|uniref:uncharacterized protein LOC129231358 n=1 Tax=Uloborus diversus TaxID=327109 RepID=UPI002409C46D|nr:uncharacterized protein LOC129231358 [Uloborus diversus]
MLLVFNRRERNLPAGMGLVLIFLFLRSAFCDSRLEPEESSYYKQTINSSLLYEDACQHVPDGTYPDVSQACRMFFICSGGQKIATFWCTKGFVFSQSTGHCKPPDRDMCPDVKGSSQKSVFLSHMIDEDCTGSDGVYPDFSNRCSSFFICKGGLKTTFNCPDSSFFDWKTRSCRKSNHLLCERLSCENKQDGIYIDSHSYCRRYFECRSGNITEYICPDGTIYNARQNRCTRSATTRCYGSEIAQCSGIPDGYYPDFAADCKVFGLCMNGGLKTFNCPANTMFDSKAMTCESNARCSKPDANKCIGKTSGIHPDYDSGCRDFYMCLDGLLTHQGSCPLGKLLNPDNGKCQPASLMSCSPVLDSDCNGLQDGVYPDYDSGCFAYFACLSGRRVSTSYCPDGELYDIATGKCLPSSFVFCHDRSTSIFPPRLFDTYNCDNRLGFYPLYSTDCRRFVTCAYGNIKFHNCPTGTSFDSDSNLCIMNNGNCKAPFALASFQCLPGDDGIYTDPNCSEWHECRNGVGFTNICPEGMMYDSMHGKCSGIMKLCSPQLGIQRRLFTSGMLNTIEERSSYFNCQQKSNGVYADEISCRKFHFCVNGETFSYSCPSGFSFDNGIKQCRVLTPNESCNDITLKEHDNSKTFTCSYLDDGMYPDFASNCRRYFVCENGKTIPVYCPDSQIFSSIKMMCDKEDNVRCSVLRTHEAGPPRHKQSRQNDDLYHVYRPEELYTEMYSYVPDKSPDLQNDRDINIRTSGDEDQISSENKTPLSTEDHDLPYNARVHNSIYIAPTSKRYNPTKSYRQQVVTETEKYGQPATVSYEELHKEITIEQRPAKVHNVRTTNRDLHAACQKGDTGFFPDYESGCKMFHICFRTIRKTYSCPSVLLFNPETKNCDLPENVACTRPEPIDGLDCRGKNNNFVANFSSGCKYYIGCINNTPYKFACPKGKIFTPITSACELEENYPCEMPTGFNSTKFFSFDEPEQRSPSSRHVHGIPGRFFFSCTDKPDGFYPDYTRHCHVFYRCTRGKKFSHYCKQGLLFNPDSGICDFEENVTCSQANKTVTKRDE